MNSSPSWQRFALSIPSFLFNRTLRFSLLRIICIFSILLLCNVPTHVFNTSGLTCSVPNGMTLTLTEIPEDVYVGVLKYERMRIIYSYLLYAFTFLHHFASAFGPRLSFPFIVDFVFVVGETFLFTLQAISSKWAFPIPHIKETFQTQSMPCKVSTTYLEIPTTVAVFTWTISVLLVLLTIMRISEALESDLWTRYDITGLKLVPRRRPTFPEKRPNGLQVLVGVKLWDEHFESEGKWIVRSRGIIAIILVALIIGLALKYLILDPVHETDEIPVKITMSPGNPNIWWESADTNVIVGMDHMLRLPATNFDLSHAVTVADLRGECTPSPPATYDPHPISNGRLYFTSFRCRPISTIFIEVNFTRLSDFLLQNEVLPPVQVIIGHSNNTSAIIRRTSLPVLLLPGMDLLGFARQDKIRRFRSPGLSALGLFAPIDEFLITEITHLQPNSIPFFRRFFPNLVSNDTASLVVWARRDYSDISVFGEYREKTVLKGFSNVGGLWTIAAFIFGALFGSSLVRVAFGVKPISIVGLAHNVLEEETLQKYRDAYPFLDSDIDALRARPGLMTLLVNHLIDFDLLAKASGGATSTNNSSSDVNKDDEDGEMSTAHHHHLHEPEPAAKEHELLTIVRRRSIDSGMPLLGEPDIESMLESRSVV